MKVLARAKETFPKRVRAKPYRRTRITVHVRYGGAPHGGEGPQRRARDRRAARANGLHDRGNGSPAAPPAARKGRSRVLRHAARKSARARIGADARRGGARFVALPALHLGIRRDDSAREVRRRIGRRLLRSVARPLRDRFRFERSRRSRVGAAARRRCGRLRPRPRSPPSSRRSEGGRRTSLRIRSPSTTGLRPRGSRS